MSKVAVIILNWNGKHFLEQFLPSVVANTPTSIADIIVADNGSTDDSIRFLSENYPSVKTIVFDKNYGFTGGYNRAIDQVANEYVVLLNSDVETPSAWLEHLLERMEANPNVGACMPKLLSQQNKHQFEYAGACGGFLDRYGYPFCRGRILGSVEEDRDQYDSEMPVFWASGACLMVRTALYKELGGLDSEFFAHMEEIDFCWRLQHAGYQVMVYPQSTVYHLGGGTLPNNNPKKMYLNFRNSLLMLTKNLPKGALYPTLFVRMVLDGAAGMAFLLSGKFSFFKAVLSAHMDFYKLFRTFYAKRREVGKHPAHGFYKKSIVLSYFLRNKRLFDQLNVNNFTIK